MCLHRVLVIVIVKSWDGRGARFKYINVREESTMVARLPQQVLLLLVLVTSTTTRTSYEPGQSDWTTASSAVRLGAPSSARSFRPTSIEEHDSGSPEHTRSLLASGNGFGQRSEEAGITVASTDSTKPTNQRLERESPISVIGYSSHDRKNHDSGDRNTRSRKQADQENVRLELRSKIAEDSEDHEGRTSGTSGASPVIRKTTTESIGDRQSGRYSTFGEEPMTRSVSSSSPSNDSPDSDSLDRNTRSRKQADQENVRLELRSKIAEDSEDHEGRTSGTSGASRVIRKTSTESIGDRQSGRYSTFGEEPMTRSVSSSSPSNDSPDSDSRDRNTRSRKQADQENVRLELRSKIAEDSEDHEGRTSGTSGASRVIRKTSTESIGDRQSGRYSTFGEEPMTRSVSSSSPSNDSPDSDSRDRNTRSRKQADQENVRLELRSKIAGDSEDHEGRTSGTSGASRVIRKTSTESIGDRQSGRYSTFGEEPMTRSVSSSSPSNDSPDSDSRDRNTRSRKQADQENVRLELRSKIAEDSEDHEGRTSGTSGASRVIRKTSTESIGDRQSGRYSTFGEEPMTRSVSSPSPASITSPLNDSPDSGSPGRSPSEDVRIPQSPANPKATLGTGRMSDITASPSMRTHRSDQGFPKVGVERAMEEFSKLEVGVPIPLNSAITVEGVLGVEASSPIPESAGMVGGPVMVRVVTSLNSHEPGPVEIDVAEEEDYDERAKFPKSSSSDRIITRSISDAFNTVRTPEKLETYESPARGLGLTLAQEEAVEVSSWRFDVPPSGSFYLPNDRRSAEDKIGETHSSLGKYDRRHIDWLTPEREQLSGTTLATTAVGFPKRYMREVPESVVCEKFQVGDPDKREFYSPYYPQNYPPLANCVRMLEAEKGMLLKLDFRDTFELEPMMPVNDKVGECRFDFLEVRDGQYGFSTLLGIFCDKNFPPEIISKSRFLWLRFHSDDTIEYRGFKAVWSTVPRPNNSGIPEELEPCIRHVENISEVIVSSDDVREEKKKAEQYGVPLDCLWVIRAGPSMKMQLSFDTFKLDKPNDCGANFLDVFGETTDVPSRLKNFCGSIAEPVNTKTNTLYIRLYLELKAINSSFKSLITAIRERGSTDKPCRADEYDCDDSTCIAVSLRCNGRHNCRFQRDEDPSMCGTTSDKLDSSRVIIILVIFSLIMFGMCSAFLFNCVRKLRRDHRIIREHIRQSRENRLDEIGRRATPCPVSVSRTDLRDRGSESPSVEVDSSKELIPSATLIAPEYTKELDLEMKYGTKEMNDIHQSNNVSNATQERLQESSEEPEMCDSSCQTRESLFDPKIPEAVLPSPEFSTFGYRSVSTSQNGMAPSHRGASQQSHHYRQHPHQPSRMPSQQSHDSHPSNSPPSRHPASERCSACVGPLSREGSLPVCPKHNPIPAPPGWSIHDPPYPAIIPATPVTKDPTEYPTYRRYQSPKPDRDPGPGYYPQHRHQGPGFPRQNTVGSGERYGSFIYGSERGSSNTASNATTTSHTTGTGSQHSSTPKYTQADPRYRAEAVIEVDQKRPFSIESTKSAPDVIATH